MAERKASFVRNPTGAVPPANCGRYNPIQFEVFFRTQNLVYQQQQQL